MKKIHKRCKDFGLDSRLRFTNVDKNILTFEYKFFYTSGSRMVQMLFTVLMTEENILELTMVLETKLIAKAFAKKLREYIKRIDQRNDPSIITIRNRRNLQFSILIWNLRNIC